MAAVLKTTDVRTRIEEGLKEDASQVLAACGLTISEALRLFLRQVVATQGLPFDVRVPSAKTARALAEAREIGRHFASMDEMLGDLDGEGSKTKARRTPKAVRVHA